MDEVPEKRCGYVSDEDLPENLGGICCWRPVWRDTSDCVWHSKSSEKTTAELHNSRQEVGERLDGANLSEMDLHSETLLTNCIVYNGDLSGTNLNKSVLSDVYIKSTDLTSIEAEEISIKDSIIDESNFSGGDFRKGEFSETDITKSDLSDSILYGCHFSEVRFYGNDLENSNLHGSIWEKSSISNNDLSSVRMSSLVMIEGVFGDNTVRESELTGAIFREISGGENDFFNSKLAVVEFENSNIWKNNFEEANLREAILEGSQVGECDFTRANVADANLSQMNGLESDFSNAELTNADFTGSNARGATFDGANLEDATFIRTELRDANLRDTRLYQTLFSDTRINSNTDFGDKSAYENPDTDLGENYDDTSNWEAAAWVYRRLQDLHEANAMSEQAREYHVRKEEAHRSDYWANSQYFQWFVYTLNRYLTRHGESLKHVVGWSIGTIVACALAYPFAGGISTGSEVFQFTSLSTLSLGRFLRSLYFSTVTFTTLGYGDYHPVGEGAKALAGAESLAGALLVALFVFVLGRRVAR